MDAGIVGKHPRIAHPVAAFALVMLQVFTNRLPGGRPVIAGIIIPNIEVAPRLIKLIKDIAKDPSVGTGFGEAIATSVIGNDRTNTGENQDSLPRERGVRAIDHVFSVFVVKISIFHIIIPVLF